MSIKGKVPFIEAVMQTMSEEELASIRVELDSSPELQEVSYSDIDENTVESVHFKFSENNYKDGILIKNDYFCILLQFFDEQEVVIYNINLSNSTYNKVNEYCTIEELRRVVYGGSSEISPISPASIIEVLSGSEYIVADLNEEGDKVEIRLDQDAVDLLEFKNIAVADITHEIIGGNTLIVVNHELFNSSKAYELLLEIEGVGSHYGTRLLVFPYNNSQCFTSSNLYMAGETDNKVIATMDSTGQINITIYDYEMTPESEDTIIHFRQLY